MKLAIRTRRLLTPLEDIRDAVLLIDGERIENKDGYVLMKVPEPNPYTTAVTRWIHKHVWLWRQAHGDVPENHVILFADGDIRNFALENLRCVPRSVLVRLNKLGWGKAAPKVRPTLFRIAVLQAKAGERRRQEET